MCIIGDDDEESTPTTQPTQAAVVEAQQEADQSTATGTNNHETSAEITSEERVSSAEADVNKGAAEKSPTGNKLYQIVNVYFQCSNS
mgnify:CR=1 FL=1